jgi:hypothetical protein
MLAFGKGDTVCPGCRCRIEACVSMSDAGRFTVQHLDVTSKKPRCRACGGARGFFVDFARAEGFRAASRLDAATVVRRAGLSGRSVQACLRALHTAMAELVFDYQDQLNRARPRSSV